jgi:putative redox protein
VVTVAAPSDPAHVVGLFRDHLAEIESAGEAQVQLAGRPFRVKRQFLEDAAEQNLDTRIARLRKALLVMHSPVDVTVDISNALDIFSRAKHPKSFVSLDSADHLLSRKSDAVYVANVIAAWSERYLPDA